MSDKEIVQRSNFLDKIERVARDSEEQITVMADRGFNIQDILVEYHVKLVIPPFLRNKRQLTMQDTMKTKRVANARIHVERVIGRMKEFRILRSELPIDQIDLLDNIFKICGALVNLQPPMVPL